MNQQANSPRSKRVAVAIRLNHFQPWHQACCDGILRYGQQAGWVCVIDPFLVGMAGQSGAADYDGVVGRLEPHAAKHAQAIGIPIVNHWVNTQVKGLPSVFMDYTATGHLAGEHLATCGYQRFAYLGLDGDKVSRLDFGGFEKAVTAKRFPAPLFWTCSPELESSRESITRFRKDLLALIKSLKTPIGIYVHDGLVARYLYQICQELNLRVPQDVGIVLQASDLREFGPTSSISYIEQDYFQVGYTAAKMLDEMLQGKPVHPLRRLVSPSQLVVRESSDVFLCEDDLVSSAMRYIAEHCRQTLKVEQVASVLGVSTSTLRRRFEAVLGRSAKEEIARLRTEPIKLLLTETDKPIAVIADECGFSSPTQLARYFSGAVGMNPNAYRSQFRDQSK